MDYFTVKITSTKIQEELKSAFENVSVSETNPTILYVPKQIEEDFYNHYLLIRNTEVFNLRKHIGFKPRRLEEELLLYRGVFDPEVNAYRVDGIMPPQLFANAKKRGFVFAIRFQSSFLLEMENKIGLIWYIREDILF